jgi:peptidoglycan-associated lipoprotein
MNRKMKQILSVTLLMAGAALLSGCPKKHNVIEPPSAGSQVSGSTQGEGASTSSRALGGDAGSQGNGMGANLTGALARKVIYFDFDKSEIKPEFADVVSAHARNLTSHPNLKMKLEGNTDERGTREYNIGLGERRAQAVRRALMLQGVAESQLNTVSFGAERPAADGDDEAAWAQNRRVEMVYPP